PAQSVPAQSVPGTLTVPAGTILLVRVNDYLSSDRNQIGDHFTAVLENPLVVNGWVVARRGQVLVGQVKEARKAGRIKGTSELGVELTDLTVVDGRQVPILTELSKGSGGTSHGQDAATIGTTTGLGALIGARQIRARAQPSGQERAQPLASAPCCSREGAPRFWSRKRN